MNFTYTVTFIKFKRKRFLASVHELRNISSCIGRQPTEKPSVIEKYLIRRN